jgi:type 2 lantibiotic biosynthesis protein LanM
VQAPVAWPGLLLAGAPFDIAARASSLGEQIRTVQALSDGGDRAPAATQLTRLDTWRLRRLARRLAMDGGDADTPSTPQGSADTLEAILGTHRSLQLRHRQLTSDEQAVLAAVHAAWLPTYMSALEHFNPSPVADRDSAAAAGQRRWLQQAADPFAQLLRREIEAVAREVNEASGRRLVGPAVVAAFESHLIERFELSLSWAVEADQNVAYARLGIDADAAGADDHDAYLQRTFCDAAAYHAFFLRFPVLGRWLAVVTRNLCDNGTRVVRRLAGDVEEIGRELFAEPIVEYTFLELGKSDHHAKGCSVAMVGVLLASGPQTLVYKPRTLGAERAMQGLLRRLADDGVIDFGLHCVVAKDGYGYEQLILSGRNHADSLEQASHVYEELGGLLAIFYILGGGDLHYENVIVADGHVHICDCETVLGVAVPGQEPATGTVLDSVYRTGLLEWPLPPAADVVLRLSACAGGESYEMPFALPRLQDGPSPAVRYETGVHVDQTSANRLFLDGRLIDARDFQAAIVEGFRAVHDWFRETPSAGDCIADLFGDTEVRFVARSTQIYSQLLAVARHPRCLMEPLEVDLVFKRLGEQPNRWDASGLAGAAEARSLWQLDIPTFAAPAAGVDLVHDHAAAVGVELERTPLQLALARIGTLSDDERERQLAYIAASLSVEEVHSATFVATALEYAQLVGDDLCGLFAEAPSRIARWTHRAQDTEPDHIEGSLYYGSAGVALFLAYLDKIRPDEGLRRAARRALADSLSHATERIGAFEGLAGQIYVLTHLSEMWGEPELLSGAIDTSRKVDALVEADRDFDVLNGSAGVIAVMLGLAGVCGEGLETADRCARHLLAHAEPSGRGLSWPPSVPGHAKANLTGFAHGAAGIGWALIALGAKTGDEEYVQAGRQAFAYERLHFDERHRDWYDLRTSILEMTGGERHFANAWCSGAAGIGLSRFASWAVLGKTDDDLLEEGFTALAATMRGFARAGNDTLCHGRSGNAELLLRCALLRGEPSFQLEANIHAQAHWRRLARTPDWPRVDGGHESLSGLMAGTAGVGMHFLRLAHPDRVPSPLLLDPPHPPR